MSAGANRRWVRRDPPARARPRHVRPHLAQLRPHEPADVDGPRRLLAEAGRACLGRAAGRCRARRLLRHRRLRRGAAARRGAVRPRGRARLLAPDARDGAAQEQRGRVVAGRRPGAPVRRRRVRRRLRRLRRAQPVRPPPRIRRDGARGAARRPRRVPGDEHAPGADQALLPALDRPRRAGAGADRGPRPRGVPLPAGVGAPFPGRAGAGWDPARRRFGRRRIPAADDGRGGAARGDGAWVSLATSAHQAFAERVEERLEQAVATDRGAVARAGAQTLRSGGKRLRPLLVSMCATDAARGRDELVRAGCAVELVHMATLVHDDVLDAAPLRRGHPTVWRTDGRGLATATGDHLFARAFAELTATGDMPAVTILADACLSLARGEILQRRQAGDPSVTVDGYLERCTLKTGRLFSAAARLGARFSQLSGDDAAALGRVAEALGLAFQMADDVLDCDGDPDTTGKPLGTDLLDGTVTLPLLLAARRDPQVAAVIARGAVPDDVLPTLARVVRSGAVAEAQRLAERATAELYAVGAPIDTEALREAVLLASDRSA